MVQKLNLWKQRDLTIYGKTLIIKTFGLSQLAHVASVLHVPEFVIKEIEDLIYTFLWNGKQHKVKKKVIIQSYEDGGCKMVDVHEFFKVQKIKWVQKALKTTNRTWKKTMQTVLGVKNLDIFLKSNHSIPVDITEFYKDVLEGLAEVKYKQNG